ncbi:MAG: glycosyltransferase family 4 protein [Anaerolineae bacterium]
MKRLRIAVLVQNGLELEKQTGASVQLRGIVRCLCLAGHQVNLYLLDGPRFIVQDENGRRRELALRTTGARWFRTLEGAVRRIQRELHIPYLALFDNLRFYEACRLYLGDYDVVYERHGLWTFSGALASRRLNRPYVLMMDGDVVFERDFLKIPLRGLQRWMAIRAEQYASQVARAVICVSEVARENLARLRGVDIAKIQVLPNAASIVSEIPAERMAATRAELNIGSAPTAVFVGSFNGWHDTGTLIKSFKLALDKLPQARLLLVGDGDLRPAMQNLAKELGIDASVNWAGQVLHERVVELIAAADVAVAPYPPEDTPFWGSPMKIFEYMAAGKAIIASRVGQIAEILESGRTGWLVAPGSVEELADALVSLLQNPELCSLLGTNARDMLAAQYSWVRYAERLEAVLAEAIA